MNTLYISYDGALDPLGYSQVVPYLLHLGQKGVRFTLLTFEKRQKLENKESFNRLKKVLIDRGIKWEILKYHKSPTLPATILDISLGCIKGLFIVIRDKVEVIHARSFVGAVPALLLAKLFRLKFIFDMRGFWADERVDGLIWKQNGLLYRIAKWWEKIFLLNADWVVCLTEEAKRITREFPYLKNKDLLIEVIPTCVDIKRFCRRVKDERLLNTYNLRDKFIFAYFGSIGTWYMFDEMLNFFKVAKEVYPNSLFLILTPDKKNASEKISGQGINPDDYLIEFSSYDDLPRWISIADVCLFFIKPSFSKKSSCPTKFAESLACGLPVITNSGIGDLDVYINGSKIGIMVNRFTRDEYKRIIKQLPEILSDRETVSGNCRKTACDFFSLESGIDKYWNIYQELAGLK